MRARPRHPAPVSRGPIRHLQGRPAGRRHRSQADQHGRISGGPLSRRTNGAQDSPKSNCSTQIRQRSSRCPGFEPSFSQPIRDNILESISQIDGQIVIKVFGDDISTLKQTAEEVLDTVSAVRGVDRGVHRPRRPGAATADRDRPASAPRVTASTWPTSKNVIETALGGKQATEIWEGRAQVSGGRAPARRPARGPCLHRSQS